MDDLLWWGLNLASLGFGQRVLPLLTHLTIQEAFRLDVSRWEQHGLPGALAARLVTAWRRVDMAAQERVAERTGAILLGCRDAHFPDRLRHIDHPPLALAVSGNIELLQRNRTLAVVGARQATDYGRDVAWYFSQQLARAGTAIISGMALGIDAQAHQGALDAGGDTIAFLGCGLDVCYPSELSGLRDDIRRRGALVSQYAFESRPLGHHFPYRNRLISGLSEGVLVVEGRMSSGSLHTVDWALQQGREVYAIPGSIHSHQSVLPHYLLQMGAVLVTSPQDLLPPSSPVDSKRSLPTEPLTPIEKHILDHLGPTPKSIEQLSSENRHGLSELLSTLLSLELRGLVYRNPANRYWRDEPGRKRRGNRPEGERPVPLR